MSKERDLAIAGVYARALLDLATADGCEAEVHEELLGLVELLDQSPAMARLVSDPLIDSEVAGRLVEKALRDRMTDLTVNTLQVMNRKGRLSLVSQLAESYRREIDVREGRVEVEVVTAVPLDDGRRERLAAVVSRYTGRQAVISARVDPSLLGGMVVKIGDRKIDTSIARELKRLGERLHERASLEVQAGRDYTAEA